MPVRGRFGGLLLGLALVLAPTAAISAEGPVMTLQQLIAKALAYSPEVRASKSEVKLAKEQRNEVHGYRYPQLDITGMTGVVPNSGLPKVIGNGNLFYSGSKNELHSVNIFGRMDFSVVQPLYTFGKIAYREEAAEKNIKVKNAAVDAKKGEVVFQVSEAYYGLILAEQGKDAVREARTYLSDTRERIDRLLRINSPNVRETDRYRLAVYEGGIEKFGAQAEEGAKVAYAALKALTGAPPNEDFKVPNDLPSPTAPQSLDHYVRTALELRPEFTQLKEGLAARQLLVDAAKADRYPSFFLAVVGQLAGAPGRKWLPDPYVIDYFNDNYAFPFAGVKWHFDFGILKAKVNQARAELEQLQHTEKTALMGIPVEVAQTHGKVQENYKGSQGLEKAYVNARRWLVTAFSNFDMGIGKLEDIFNAFERYGSFRGDYLMALYEYNVNVAKLGKVTGAYRRSLPAEAPLVPAKKQ
ncbi:MAG: TolC family protein [Deltaproteobacteria bacterium]|nr:TolC family protein [Deltaproteobacteria bacterium]